MKRALTFLTALAVVVLLASPLLAEEDCSKQSAVVEKAGQARGLVGEKKYAEAEGPAGEAVASCPTSEQAVAVLGEALSKQEKHDAVIERMSGVLGKSSTVAYAYYWRGKAYNAKKQQARMVDDFEAFLKLAPDAPEAAAVKQLLAALK
jgi:tetratricopeptide (TPR) repeat protein